MCKVQIISNLESSIVDKNITNASNLLVVMAKKKEQQNNENNNKSKCVLQGCIHHYLHLNDFFQNPQYFLKETQIEGDN